MATTTRSGLASVLALGLFGVGWAAEPAKVTLGVELERDQLAPGEDECLYATVRVAMAPRPADEAPRPLALSFVLDVSGSMGGRKIEDMKAAVQAMLRRLGPGDMASVVAFESTTHDVYVRPGPVDVEAACRAVGGLRSMGSTDMVDGIRLGIRRLRELPGVGGAVKRMFVLGDGQANLGAGDMERVAAWVRDDDAAISTFGVGQDYDRTAMQRLAQVGGGNFRDILDSSKLQETFDREFDEVRGAAVCQATLNLKARGDLVVDRVFGQPAAMESGPLAVAVPDLDYGATRTMVARLKVRPGAPGRRGDLLAQLTWLDRAAVDGRQAVATRPFAWATEPGPRNLSVAELAAEAEARDVLEALKRADGPALHGESPVDERRRPPEELVARCRERLEARGYEGSERIGAALESVRQLERRLVR